MLAYRISKAKYAEKLEASGAANRWNKAGQFVIYASESRALASLELVVHRSAIIQSETYKLMVIKIPTENQEMVREIQLSDLPPNWNTLQSYPRLQEIGSAWFEKNESLILKVPSALIPQEHNFVINTKHDSFSTNVKLIGLEDFYWDGRLF
ncbi:RES family NAD+ phosphorylase [Aquiflexum sp. LQ15W]|uniref:RES family NAD+ phosphorylase n=1 Tax=Cognataquiflexum nitidum TaxID=2922272 RepID=UPI001F142E8B|nr:RES family NAD+ phosphorylase [Cognataquiflexum nitidum]MCH6199952.1 RES family NAD+ phosphorylase [Cognataquiflexum nitidum]